MFGIVLDAFDRLQVANEASYHEPMKLVLTELMSQENWMKNGPQTFMMHGHNLERYLQYCKNVYVSVI